MVREALQVQGLTRLSRRTGGNLCTSCPDWISVWSRGTTETEGSAAPRRPDA